MYEILNLSKQVKIIPELCNEDNDFFNCCYVGSNTMNIVTYLLSSDWYKDRIVFRNMLGNPYLKNSEKYTIVPATKRMNVPYAKKAYRYIENTTKRHFIDMEEFIETKSLIHPLAILLNTTKDYVGETDIQKTIPYRNDWAGDHIIATNTACNRYSFNVTRALEIDTYLKVGQW